uniref:Coiled-coil domain-containing protein 88B n=1 Tax=Pogona vitticeps TaxID=103695 RepID=A0ABM5F4M5_9SAUR
MDGDDAEMVEDFISGPLVTWVQTMECLADSRSDQPTSPQEKQNHECRKEYFVKLVNGDFLIRIMETIDMISEGRRLSWSEPTNESYRLQTLQTLLQRLRDFYQNDLQQLILSSPPNIYLLAHHPFTAQAVGEMKKLLLLLLGGAVQCERRDKVIGSIQTLDITTQAALVSAIQEVTREPENVLRLSWKDLGPSEAEQLLREAVPRIQELVHERDVSLEKLWELQQEQKTQPAPLPENHWQHLGVQLAEAWAEVRRLRQELEEKVEEMLDQQDERKDLEEHLQKLKQENRALAGEARLAGLYRDEVDALREKALQTERLQAEVAALRERLPALEQCRAQLKEERGFSQALLETKAMLEGQLEAARARGQQRLNQLEKEKMHLQACLNQVQEERDHLYQQAEDLLGEKMALERQLRQSLGETPEVLRAEEIERVWTPREPSEAPLLLGYEIKEAGQWSALERENQELRQKLQEALETKEVTLRLENAVLDRELKPLQSQAEPEPKVRAENLAIVKGQEQGGHEGLVPDKRKTQSQKQEAEGLLGERESALPEVRIPPSQVARRREAESHQRLGLEDSLRSLQEAHTATLEKQERQREQWRLERERLTEEIQALEREQEILQAGSGALQAAATQAELALEEARRSLQEERLQGVRLAQKARQADEALHEAQKELDALQRSREQHKIALAQLEAEKGALEEMLSEAENRRRRLEKDSQRLKAQVQVQEEALAAQGARLARLEAQTRQQARELDSLREAARRLQDSEREAAGLRERLDAECETSARLKEELQQEKAKGKEAESTFAQLREQMLTKEAVLQEEAGSEKYREEKHAGPSNGNKMGMEEENNALKRQLEELQARVAPLTNNQQAKSSIVAPPVLEPRTQLPVGQSPPDTEALPLQLEARTEALSARLIQVERENAVLQAEKSTLAERLSQLESHVDSRRAKWQGRGSNADEESEQRQAQSQASQVEAALLRSQQVLLESQLSDLRQRLALAESEAQASQRAREEWRGRYEALLRDHDRLTVLHERQGVDLEGLLGKQSSLKGDLRRLEQEYRELQSRHSQLLGQKTGLEEREEALREQKKHLEEAERRHQELAEQHSNLKEEHERVKQMLSQAERGRDDLQGELQGMRNRMTSLQLEQAKLEAESATLKEQNQQLDTALGRLTHQCELLAQLKGNQEEENRHLLQEIQALSRENRRLLEHSMESREHFQEEQRQYLDKLGELRREKQKLVEKIMDQYRVLEPALPRGKKSNWITEKIRKLMKPRREAFREQLRPMAEGAGSSESLTGQESHSVDGSVSSTPSSPAPLRKTSSALSLLEAQQVHFHRRRLSSRMPAVNSPGAGEGEGQDTPRQRFRQRRLGMLGSSREEAVITAVEWEITNQKRGE